MNIIGSEICNVMYRVPPVKGNKIVIVLKDGRVPVMSKKQ